MRLVYRLAVAAVVGLAGCAHPDPGWDAMHAQSSQEARALVGRDYMFTAPAWVCRERNGVFNRALAGNLVDAGCRMVSAGRFRIEEAIVLPNDGRSVLRIAGPDVAGYMAYFAFVPKPFKDVGTYFPTGK